MPLVSMKLKNLGPFTDIAFEFDPKVNVFVGPNNCGKTTALLALAVAICGLGHPFPQKLVRREGVCELKDLLHSIRLHWPISSNMTAPLIIGGGIRELESITDALGYKTFVPAIRLCKDFRSKGPISGISVDDMLPDEDQFGEPPLFYMQDESVIQQIVDLDYRGLREKNRGIMIALGLIGELASRITEGFPLSFEGVKEDKMGLFPQFGTPDGSLPLNALSQGTQSIIQWCAQLVIGYAEHYKFPETLADKPGVLIIDEIDAHLHPSWQRRIIPALTETLPALQIFCATHSPLMLAGLKAGQVQLLTRDDKGKVTVSRNEKDIIGWTADEIYSSFMDIHDPTDLKTKEKLDQLRELRGKKTLSAADSKKLEGLRADVGHILRSGPGDEIAQRVNEALRVAKQPKLKPAKR